MMNLDGRLVSASVKNKLREQVSTLVRNGFRKPKLAVILVGEDKASQTYVRNKEKACEYVGIDTITYKLKEDVLENVLLSLIMNLNLDDTIDGILVQLPLPKHINEKKVLNSIASTKDVDGFHPTNVAKLLLNEDGFVPCTPKGIMYILNYYNIDVCGKRVVIVGRSNIVGKPLSMLMLNNNATVTICHSKTNELHDICRDADILVCAIGKPKFFNRDFVSNNQIVIDVGINRDNNGKLCGDCDYDDIKDIVSYITPVPGGVGPMTIAMLLQNTYKSYLTRR